MFFSRRKHAAPSVTPSAVPQPAAPQLTDELIFAAVQQRLVEVFGEDGQWTVARRTGNETDAIFREVFVHSLATAVTEGVSAARTAVVADPLLASGPLGLLRAPKLGTPSNDVEQATDAAGTSDDEPAALRWQPAPITVWADLRRPVTGPVAVVNDLPRKPLSSEDRAA